MTAAARLSRRARRLGLRAYVVLDRASDVARYLLVPDGARPLVGLGWSYREARAELEQYARR